MKLSEKARKFADNRVTFILALDHETLDGVPIDDVPKWVETEIAMANEIGRQEGLRAAQRLCGCEVPCEGDYAICVKCCKIESVIAELEPWPEGKE